MEKGQVIHNRARYMNQDAGTQELWVQLTGRPPKQTDVLPVLLGKD